MPLKHCSFPCPTYGLELLIAVRSLFALVVYQQQSGLDFGIQTVFHTKASFRRECVHCSELSVGNLSLLTREGTEIKESLAQP